MQLLNILFHSLDTLVQAGEPVKTILISGIMTTLTCLFVMLIGIAVEHIEQLELRLLNRVLPSKTALFIEDRLTFPGTMLHECAHAFFAWLTGAQVLKVKLLVFFNAHKLGEVLYRPRGTRVQQAVQMAFASCAPVIMGILELSAIIKIWQYFQPTRGIKLLLIYLFICIFNHMSMSDADVKGYLRGLAVLYPVIFLIYYAIRLYAFR